MVLWLSKSCRAIVDTHVFACMFIYACVCVCALLYVCLSLALVRFQRRCVSCQFRDQHSIQYNFHFHWESDPKKGLLLFDAYLYTIRLWYITCGWEIRNVVLSISANITLLSALTLIPSQFHFHWIDICTMFSHINPKESHNQAIAF